MRLGAVAVFIAIGILSGCGDSTGPGRANVQVTVLSQSGPDIAQPTPSEISITCSVGLNAINTGGPPATWADSWMLFFAGPNRSVPVDTFKISAATMEQAWGAATIEGGHNQYSGWTLTANVPFAVTFVFRYRSGLGLPREVRTSFQCGPDVPSGGAPPSFKSVGIQPATGEIQSGDSVLVTYTAESTVGLWETIVVMSGACDAASSFPEQFTTTVTRTVKLFVPAGCTLGRPLDIAVQAFDIALRGVQTGTSLTYVDRTPPTVGAWFGIGGSPTLAGFFFTGDTLVGAVGAADNNQLSAAFWEVWPVGKRDSVHRAEQSLAEPFTIPIPDTWVGKIQMRFYSRDAAGLVSDTILSPPDSLRIYPTVGRLVRYTQPILDIYALAPDMRRHKAWVLKPQRVYGVSLASMALTDTIAVRGGWDLDLTPGGDSLIVGSSYGLDVIDLRASPHTVTHVTLTSVDSTRGQYPQLIRVAANGKVFVITLGQTVNDNVLVEVDLKAGTDRVRTDAGNGGVVNGVGLEPSLDRSLLFLKSSLGIQKYVSATDAFSAPVPVSLPGGGVAVDATGSRVTIGWDLYDGALQFLRHLDTPAQYPTMAAALSPDGTTYYHATWPWGILSGNAQTGQLIDRQRTPQSLYMKMAPDGSKIIFVDAQFGRVGVIDLQ